MSPTDIEFGWHSMSVGLDALADGKVRGAQVYRDGLMIAALAARPALRRRNLAALRIGLSFERDATGVHVTFSGKETKKDSRIDFYYPEWLNEPFDIFLAGEDDHCPQATLQGYLAAAQASRLHDN